MKKIKIITGLTTLAIAGGTTPVVATACHTNTPELSKPSINVVPIEGAKLDGGKTVTTPKAIGSFMLIDGDGKIIQTDQSSNITLAFVGTNNTGLTDQNIGTQFDSSTGNYTVSIKNGTTADVDTVGTISISWGSGKEKVTAPTNLTISIVKDSSSDPSINVIPGENPKILGGNSVTDPIVLGSFVLLGSDEKIVKTDQTNNLTVAFTGTNNTGFVDSNIEFKYNSSTNMYTVSLKDGTANNESTVGNISVKWNVGGTEYPSSNNLTITVIKTGSKTLTKTIYGPDMLPLTEEEPTIPVIKDSGIYLDISDAESNNRVNAQWVLLGGNAYVELINESDVAPINGLKVNNVPATGSAQIIVKAIPEDTSYDQPIFTINITKASAEQIAVITANEGSTEQGSSVLQYQSTQAMVGDNFTFNLKNGDGEKITVTQWSVTKAEGGDKDDPAEVTDVSFGSSSNVLQVNEVHKSAAEYTIAATYGNATAYFVVKLFAGATVSAKFQTDSSAEQTTIETKTELANDLAIGNIFTINLSDYDGDIEYWTAEYEDLEGVHTVPSFVSPSVNKTTAVWTVNALDIENIPACAYITFNAYSSYSKKPIATFMVQAKVHVLTTVKGWNGSGMVLFPHVYTGTKAVGSTFTFSQTNGARGIQGNVDGTSSTLSFRSKIFADPIHPDYYSVVNNDTSSSMTLTKSGVNAEARIKIWYTMPTTNIKIVIFSTITCTNVKP